MAKSEEYKLLSKCRSDMEELMRPELDWIADQLKEVALLTDMECNDVKNPASTRTPDQKAAMVFSLILNRVDVDSGALGKFVGILKKKPETLNVLIERLYPKRKWML